MSDDESADSIFVLLAEQLEIAVKWSENHMHELHSMPFTYEFTPTPVGDVIRVRCNVCGERKELSPPLRADEIKRLKD